MAYSATLANLRGILSDTEHKRILNLFSRAGLSMDHAQFDEDILDKATKAILRTRDGKLRAAVPSPLGSCVFLNDVEMDEMYAALRKHKEIMKEYPRNGEGLSAFVDSSDTGYTMNDKPVETNGASEATNGLEKLSVVNDDTKPDTNGRKDMNGSAPDGVPTLGAQKAKNHASGQDKDSVVNGSNGHAELHECEC
jgi:3-dehydroquinate synthase